MILRDRRARDERARCRANRASRDGARATVGSVVTRHDVDDATDRVSPVKCRALRTADDLDALDGLGSELRHQQRIRELDAVDINLRIAGAERAAASNAAVVRE